LTACPPVKLAPFRIALYRPLPAGGKSSGLPKSRAHAPAFALTEFRNNFQQVFIMISRYFSKLIMLIVGSLYFY
jgi:hypothetical protein